MKNFLLLIFTFSCFTVFSQSALEDASQLRKLVDSSTGKLGLPDDQIQRHLIILRKYIKNGDTIKNGDRILKEYYSPTGKHPNPFIGPYITLTGQSGAMDALLGKALSGSVLGSVGSLNVTSLADGLGKFLANRTKEELNITFFNRFKELLNTHPEIGVLFPVTTTYLNSILNYEYTNMLSTLRAAFESDLKNLAGNLPKIQTLDPEASCKCSSTSKTDKCKSRLKYIQDAFKTREGQVINAGFLITDDIIKKKKPEVISTETIDLFCKIFSDNKDLVNALKLARIISKSIAADNTVSGWTSKTDLESVINDPITLSLFTGLIYQQIKNEDIIINDVKINNVLNSTAIKIADVKAYYNNISSSVTKLEDDIKKINNPTDTSKSARIALVRTTSADLESLLINIVSYDQIDPQIPKIDKSVIVNSFSWTNSAIDISEKIIKKDYYNALLNTTLLIENILQTNKYFNSKGEFADNLSSEDQEKVLAQKEFVMNFLRYGNFMANIVFAQNSEDAEKAISAIALPPGSSSIKRTTNFNIAVQGYTGLSAGHIVDSKPFINAMSIYAPIGVSFSLGLKSHKNPLNKRTGGSLTAMATLIDLGAVVSYRLKDPDTQLADSVVIRLENIFAPGINLIYGIPKTPLSLGGGVKWQPSITRLSSDKVTLAEKSGFMWHLFLAIDIPLLNIYTSRR